MKNKKIMLMSFVLPAMLGIALGLNVETSNAQQLTNAFDDGGDKIPCWSSGTIVANNRYVDCAVCTSKVGSPTGGSSKCTN